MPTPLLVTGISVALIVSVLLEIGWHYRRDMQWHEELKEKCGTRYSERFETALAEKGMSHVCNGVWFAKAYDEFILGK